MWRGLISGSIGRREAMAKPRRPRRSGLRPSARRLQLEPLEERRLLAVGDDGIIYLSGVGSSVRDFNLPGQVLVGPATVSIDGDSMSMLSIATVLESRPLPDGTIFGRVTHTFEFGDGSTLTTLDHSRLVPTGTPGVSQFRPSRVITGGTGIFAGAAGRLGTIPGESNFINLFNQSATWSLRGAIAVPAALGSQPAINASPGATITVVNTLDSGPGSLRQALLDANAAAGLDTIEFDIPGAGPHSIAIVSPLPEITDPVTIDAATTTGVPGVVLDGTGAGDGADGLYITAGQTTVRGLAIVGFDDNGILIEERGGNTIEGNYIGVDATGNIAVANGRDGIAIFGAADNRIGGTSTDARNVISGNLGAGVSIVGAGATGNQVLGNYIGTNVIGAVDLGNAFDGVLVANAPDNTIGSLDPRGRNIISGNDSSGIAIIGPESTGNLVQGNAIGTNALGAAALGNALDGVAVVDAPGNTIGGTQFGDFGQNLARNLVSGNVSYGVTLLGEGATGNQVQGNYIGVDELGLNDLGNAFDGLLIDRAPGNLVGGTAVGTFGQNVARNVISGNDVFGITILGEPATGNVVEGNYIGTDISGAVALGNGFDGIVINSAPGNLIGGTTLGQFGNNLSRNVISSNGGDGVALYDSRAAGNVIEGNYIGTDAPAFFALGNGRNGIFVSDAPGNRVGGKSFAAANVISGNDNVGVHIVGSTAAGNVLEGNFIGTDAFGGDRIANAGNGVFVERAFNNTIGGTDFLSRNVISGNGRNGVEFVSGSAGNTVQGNYIGVDITGSTDLGNATDGLVLAAATDNVVGGPEPGARNVISGNGGNGVIISFGSTGNILQNNLIGTDSTGTAAVGNSSNGILIANAADNTFGGATPGLGNVISGNTASGVLIFGIFSTGNLLQGNRIGTDITGTADLGNAAQGVLLNNTAGNTIGGAGFGAGNIISGNDANGVLLFGGETTGNVLLGNLIGTQAGGASPLPNTSHGVFITAGASGNTVGGDAGNAVAYNQGGGVMVGFGSQANALRKNSVHSNAGLGIDLGADGPTANDPGDNDPWQNFPVLTAATSTAVLGTISSKPSAALTIDLFASDSADPSGFGEGQRYLGSATVTTDALGSGSFAVPLLAIAEGDILTATATDSNGNTSEFSAPLVVGDLPDDGGQEGDPLVKVHLEVSATAFGPAVTRWGNDTFWVNVYVEDLRPEAVGQLQGIVGGAIDVLFDTLHLQPTGAVTYGSAFNLFRQGAADDSGGLINETGALTASAGQGADQPARFVAWQFRSDGTSGAVEFTPDPGEGGGAISPANFAIVGRATPVPWSRVEFVSAQVTLETEGDFNGDGARNQFDLALFIPQMFIPPSDPRFDPRFDLTGDGLVNQFDLAQMIPLLFSDSTAATLVVTNTQDSGAGSLRQAILTANQSPDADVIHFSLPGSGVRTIELLSPLPPITAPVKIDGTSQPGFQGDLLVELNGAQAGNDADGLTIAGGDSTVRGLIINRFGGWGVVIDGGSGNVIAGNLIGTDHAGATALGNGGGVLINGSAGNMIGGTDAEARNVISGNQQSGIEIAGAGATGNVIAGNFVGVGRDGVLPLGNLGGGVLVAASVGNGDQNNTIGGRALGEGNTIAFNGGVGVAVAGGIGTSIYSNLVYSNNGLGIDLGLDGATANDIGDADAGANNLQNFPVLVSATNYAGFTTVQGTFTGAPDSEYHLEFFASPTADPSGFGEGKIFLGIETVTTDAQGAADIYFTFPPLAPVGHLVTATATSPDGSSSEFSAPVPLEALDVPDVGMEFYLIPTPISQPTTVITGPDGNVYFTEQLGNKIGRLNTALLNDGDPANDITEFPIPTTLPPNPINPTGSTRPIAQAFDNNGMLWFNELFGNAIGRFDPATGTITEFPLPVPNSQPGGMTLGPNGNIWFNENTTNRIGRFDPNTIDPANPAATITYFVIPTTVPPTAPPPVGDNPSGSSQPRFIRPGPDGNIYFTEFASNKIGRINLNLLNDGDPANDISEFNVPFDPNVVPQPNAVPVGVPGVPTSNILGSSQPRGLAPGPDGNMWFTEFAANKIGRLNLALLDDADPANDVTEFEIPTPNSIPFGIVAGPDGNLWFAEHGVGKIGVISPQGDFLAEIPLPTPLGPSDIQPGPNGSLVMAAGGGNRIVVLTNPDANAAPLAPQPLPILPPPERTGVTLFASGFTGHVGGLTLDPSGENFYFSEQFDGRVGRFNIATQTVTEWTVPAGLLPHSAKIGPSIQGAPNPEGAIWWSGLGSGFVVLDLTTEQIAILGYGGGPGNLTPGSELHDYVFTPDGHMWFTEQEASVVGRLNLDRNSPDYLKFEEFPISFAPGVTVDFHTGDGHGTQPHNIIIAPADVFGPDKLLIALEHVDRIAVYDTVTKQVTQLFNVDLDGGEPDRAPHDLEVAPGPGGKDYVYFTQLTGHRLGRLDMQTGEVVEFPTLAPPAAPGSSSEFAMEVIDNAPSMFHLFHHEETNSIWFTLQQHGRVGRLDIDTETVTEYSMGITPGRGPLVLREGPDGTIWFSTVSLVPTLPGGLVRLDPRLAEQALHPIVVGSDPGEEPRVQVFDSTGRKWLDFLAFAPDVDDGVQVVLADVNLDGTPEIVASTLGGSPQMAIFDLATGLPLGGNPNGFALLSQESGKSALWDAALSELLKEEQLNGGKDESNEEEDAVAVW